MEMCRAAIASSLVVSLIASLVSGCSWQNQGNGADRRSQQGGNTTTPQPTNQRPTNQRLTTQPSTNQTQSSQSERFVPTERQNARCLTPNYFADITWSQGQPTLKVGERPAQTMLTSPATMTSDVDGNVLYFNQRGETNVTVGFGTTGGCTLQIADANGQLTLNEMGQATIQPINPPNSQTYRDGYAAGYDQGYRDGKNARLYNAGYYPNNLLRSEYTRSQSEYNRGYKDGFYKGFEDGYNSVEPLPTPTTDPIQPITPPALW